MYAAFFCVINCALCRNHFFMLSNKKNVKKIKKSEKKKLMWICVDLCGLCGLLKKMSPALANVYHINK
jgi:hypothetical protein